MRSVAEFGDLSIAVAIPCFNEEAAIGQVVADFRAALPRARIYVYDNRSTDNTAQVARAAGAIVRCEPERGKGNVVRRMFSDIEADLYVLADGDGTYPADQAPRLIEALVSGHMDMVSGARIAAQGDVYRRGHRFGNALITHLVGLAFGRRFSDVLSGFRVFSKRFVKSFPVHASGFEVETEIAVHALEMRLPATELEVPYRKRPTGSPSKLRTVHDGVAIFRTIVLLIKEERPLAFFSACFAVVELAALVLAWPLLGEYLRTGLVPRLPTTVLATGLALLGFIGLACGLVLDTVTRARREAKHLRYLAFPGLPVADAETSGSNASADTG